MMGRARPTLYKEVTQGGLGRLADQIRALSVVQPLVPMRDTLVDALCELDSGGPVALEERARLAIAACRRFHEAVWDAIAAQREILLADATVELESLRSLLKGAAERHRGRLVLCNLAQTRRGERSMSDLGRPRCGPSGASGGNGCDGGRGAAPVAVASGWRRRLSARAGAARVAALL